MSVAPKETIFQPSLSKNLCKLYVIGLITKTCLLNNVPTLIYILVLVINHTASFLFQRQSSPAHEIKLLS